MKKKISTMLISLIFVVGITACASQKMPTIKDTSKVLVTVEGKNITQQMVDMTRTNSTFTEKQMLDKLIDDELILIKAKELKITVTDKEAKAEAKKQRDLYEDALQKADNKNEVKTTMDDFIKKLGITEEEYWNSYVVQAYKGVLITAKTKDKLGADIEKTLKELRVKAKINYYN
jgi:hypothetical protein